MRSSLLLFAAPVEIAGDDQASLARDEKHLKPAANISRNSPLVLPEPQDASNLLLSIFLSKGMAQSPETLSLLYLAQLARPSNGERRQIEFKRPGLWAADLLCESNTWPFSTLSLCKLLPELPRNYARSSSTLRHSPPMLAHAPVLRCLGTSPHMCQTEGRTPPMQPRTEK